MVLEQRHERVGVVDAREDLLEVSQSELLLLKFNNNIDVFFRELVRSIRILIKLLDNLLKVRLGDEVQCVLSFQRSVQSE